MFQTVLYQEVNKDDSLHKSILVEFCFDLLLFDMTMGDTMYRVFSTGVRSVPSSNDTRSFRENIHENTE